ncbi:MAG: hypothetical protein D6809_02860, partial [Gammaproteobacteria bacterium]
MRLALVGTAAAALPGMALGAGIGTMQDTQTTGGGTIQFGTSWSQTTNGNINYTCPTGYSCSTATAITDAGFYQVQLTDTKTGAQYFQTIIADQTPGPGAGKTNTFSDESFVKMGAVNGGLANQQKITSWEGLTASATTAGLSSTVEIKTGDFGAQQGTAEANFATGDNLAIVISQGVTDGSSNFGGTFDYKEGDQTVTIGGTSHFVVG